MSNLYERLTRWALSQFYRKHEHIYQSDGTQHAKRPILLDANGLLDPSLYGEDATSYTPTVTAATTNPTLTYTTQLGSYAVVGPIVFYAISIKVNTISVAGSGAIRISLPKTVGSESLYTAAVDADGFTFSDDPTGVVFLPIGGQSYGQLFGVYDAAGHSTQAVTGLANGTGLRISGFYFT